MNEIDAYILIGGRSSRLGRDKAFVNLAGKTLMQHAVDAVSEGLEPSRVTAVAANASQFAIGAIVADVPFIFDLHENRGPLAGLHAALAYAETPWIFILACDYPFLSPEFINVLSSKVDDKYGCVVPEQNDGRLQPLCGFYKVSVAMPIVEEVIEEPRVPPPMHEIVSGLTPRIVRFDEYSHLDNADRLFVNINTLDDLRSANSGNAP
jgi:molybdopterin-guanine dinucleotide biosynthesis protein A